MARVALLTDPGTPGFARHRAALFADALADHALRVLDVRSPTLAADLAPAELLVTAGAYAPTRAALDHVGDRPLFLDLPGDPFADAQAYGGGDPAVADHAAALFLPALARGDAFATISERARYALIGQLGLLGRVAGTAPTADLVHVIPVAWSGPPPLLRPRPPRPRPLRVVLAGSFNTWLDDETLLRGLLRAMDAASVEVRVLGGPVPGHAEAGWTRFGGGVRASRHRARFSFHPWVEEAALPALLADAHVGIVLDRPGLEPELGSRTRLLFFLQHGLAVVATARCELAAELAGLGLLHAVPPGDADAVADALLGDLPAPDATPIAARYAPERVVAPLRAWAAAPRRLPRAPSTDLLVLARREQARLEAELDAWRRSRTARVLRWIRR